MGHRPRSSRAPDPAKLGAGPVLASLLPLLLASPVEAQHTEPPPPAAYAVEGATVVRAPGDTTRGATVVVRNGLVEGLGRDVEVPADARVVEGDSLWIYPGMVDADGGAGYEFPPPDSGDGEISSWSPPRWKQGYLPHRRVAEHLTATGRDLADARRAGIVAAAVHPDDALMPGRSALLLHRTRTRDPRALVLNPDLGPVMAFEPASRAYPSTLFGVIAFLRQELEDAARSGRVRAAFAENPAGLTPPGWDPDRAVLRRALEGGGPVFFRASRSNDIRRALDLAADHGFRTVLLEGGEAWKVAELLRGRDVPVLVSLDFPRPVRWKPEEEPTPEAAPPESDTAAAPPDTAAAAEAPAAADTLPPEALREKRRLEDLYANPARLADAGVAFALTTGGGEVDLREGVRKAMEYGLSADDALRAVTSVPARLLGRPSLVRVEEGMAANFVVTDGPLFAEDTRVRATFVSGRLEEGETPGEEPEEPPAVDVTGTWSVEIETGQGSFEGELTLQQEGHRVDGSLSTSFGTMQVTAGTVSGNDLSLTIESEIGGESVTLEMSGTAEGDEASGTGSGPFGSFTWEAERSSDPGGSP